MEYNYSGGHLVAAFLGGAAAGAAVALLTAPRAGRDTRQAIRGYMQTQTESAARLPEAVKAARGAAREAFSRSMNSERSERSVVTPESIHHAE